MRTKELAIICITLVIVIAIICGTLIYINQSNTDYSQENNTTQNMTNNNTTKNATTEKSATASQTSQSIDTDDDGYIDGNQITYRNKNYLGEDSGLEQFMTNKDVYLKQKSTGRIAKRHLDSDGAYRFYDMQSGEYVFG